MAQKLFVRLGTFGAIPIAALQDPDLKPNDIRVLIAVSSFQGTDDECYPSIEKLAERAGISRTQTSTAASRLVKQGWLFRKRRMNNSNIYRMMMPVIDSDIQYDGIDGVGSEIRNVSGSEIRNVVRSEITDTKRPCKKTILKDHVPEDSVSGDMKERIQGKYIPDRRQELAKEIIRDLGNLSPVKLNAKGDFFTCREIAKKLIDSSVSWQKIYLLLQCDKFWSTNAQPSTVCKNIVSIAQKAQDYNYTRAIADLRANRNIEDFKKEPMIELFTQYAEAERQ